ncbi:hypothetical protein BY458DRAFT_509832 [Sporodiniella umbellata]|nr:hypothetical protein BY458DRAFT_509832 [Sporodiniella umbellata]
MLSQPDTNIQKHTHYSEPCSPVSSSSFLSNVSCMAEKSASELATLLKNAYKSIREKEKDLILVAEIGKSLLEHNQSLKTNYDKLLQNVSQLNEGEDDMRLVSNKRAFDKMIESLQYKNEEIQHMLDRTHQHSTASQQTHARNKRKLETEIEILQKSLDSAASKIQELEEERLRSQLRANRQYEMKVEQQHKEDILLLEELSGKMEDLHRENGYLVRSKRALEEKLALTLRDLDRLRKEFEGFELTQQGYQTLQEAFERQTAHVRELNERLEEHQTILSRHAEPILSPVNDNLRDELSLAKAEPKHTCAKLYDLASLTEKHLALFCSAPADYALDTLLSTVGIGNRANLQEAEKLLLATDEPELFGPDQSQYYAERDLYPSQQALVPPTSSDSIESMPKGLIQRILLHIRHLFRSIFRWCRFALILVTAVLINLWKGPDLISAS